MNYRDQPVSAVRRSEPEELDPVIASGQAPRSVHGGLRLGVLTGFLQGAGAGGVGGSGRRYGAGGSER